MMTIELHNFGPIKYFKFDLDRDLHAIFGKNNIGKSYALSAVYLLLKGLTSYRSERVRYFESEEFYYFYGALLHSYVGNRLTVLGIPNLVNRFKQVALIWASVC